MKWIITAAALLLATPAAAVQLKGIVLNPYTGYVGAIVIQEGAKVQPHHLAACGNGCEFTDIILPGQCMVVSISRRDAAWGYHFGPADDLANSRAQARHYCQRYGGSDCQEYRPICN